jgi:hypothetical protein
LEFCDRDKEMTRDHDNPSEDVPRNAVEPWTMCPQATSQMPALVTGSAEPQETGSFGGDETHPNDFGADEYDARTSCPTRQILEKCRSVSLLHRFRRIVSCRIFTAKLRPNFRRNLRQSATVLATQHPSEFVCHRGERLISFRFVRVPFKLHPKRGDHFLPADLSGVLPK